MTKKTVMFYGYCGFEGATIFDFSHSVYRYFSHAMPAIEYRTCFKLHDPRGHALNYKYQSIELHQNGSNVVQSALRWLQNLFIV